MSGDDGQLPPATRTKERDTAGYDVDDGGVDMARVIHRETHPSRALAAVLAAVLAGLAATYGLLEAGVHAVGQPAWLVEPQVAAERITALPQGISRSLLGAAGAVVALAGLIFLLQAALPGRRARHALDTRKIGIPARPVAVVVDDEIIASALARRARLAANVSPEQVMVIVYKKQVLVNVRPTSGAPVRDEEVAAAVREELAAMAPVPLPEVRVAVADTGVIGA